MQQKLEKIEELDYFLQQSNHQPLLIKFSAVWCSPCQRLKQEITKLVEENNKLMVVEIDVEKFPVLVQNWEFSITSIPALFFFVKGEIKKSHYGYLSLEELREFVKI